jgi:hypothetical protein
LEVSLDAGREGDAQQCCQRGEEQAEGHVGWRLGLSLLKSGKTRCGVWCGVVWCVALSALC